MQILDAIKQLRDDLKTWVTNNLVALDNKIESKTIPIDNQLSTTSTNPVQNKVIKQEIDSLNSLVEGLATEEYVDNAIAGIEFPETDLTNYYNKEETDSVIENFKKEIGETIVSESDSVNIVDEFGNIILSVDADGVHTTDLTLNGDPAATETYVDNAINNINFPETDLTNYYNKEETDSVIENFKKEIGETIVSESDSVNIVDDNGNTIVTVDANGVTTTIVSAQAMFVNGTNVEIAFDNLSYELSTHAENCNIHVTKDDKEYWNDKVDKVDGKTLSTNDFTDEYKDKVDSALQSYTETDPTVPDWAKEPTKPTYTSSEIGLGNVDNTSDLDKPVSTATQTALDNLKKELSKSIVAGSDGWEVVDESDKAILRADVNGVYATSLYLDGENAATELYVDDAIANIEFPTTDLTGYATEAYVDSAVADLVNSAPEALDTLGELATALESHADAYEALLEVVGGKATFGDLENMKIELSESIVSEQQEFHVVDENRNVITSIDSNGLSTTTVTAHSITVNGDNIEEHIDNTNIHVTVTDKETWNNKSDFSGSYNDLTDKPAPTDLSNYYTKDEVDAAIDNIDFPETDLTGYATEAYVDAELSNKADITHAHDEYLTADDVQTELDNIDLIITNITSGKIVVAEATHAESADNAIEATHATSADTATNANEATHAVSSDKATKDANGNVITEYYETKSDSSAKLDTAKEYADGLIAALDVTDAVVDGQYVAAVSEINGKITVSRASLPDYSGTYAPLSHTHDEYLVVGDIAGKADKIYVDTELAKKADSDHTHEEYLVASDIAGKADKTELHQHGNKTVLDGITSSKVSSWDDKADKTYVDTELTKKANATHVHDQYLEASDIEGYATETYVNQAIVNAQLANKEIDLSSYYTKTETDTKIDEAIDAIEHPTIDLAPYATTEYVDTQLETKANSNHTHDQYLTSIPSEYITESELYAQGYLTEHQDLSDYAKTIDVDNALKSYYTKADIDNKGYAIAANVASTYSTKTDVDTALANKVDTAIYDTDKASFATKTDINNMATKSYVGEQLSTKADTGHTHDQYLTSIPAEYVTDTELNAKGYLTEHQSLDDYAKTDDIPDVSSFITMSDVESKNYLTAHQDISHLATISYVDTELVKKVDSAEISHTTDAISEGATIANGKLSIVVDAYTKAETLNKIREKITEINGGESAGEVLSVLNSYVETNDVRVGAIEEKNNAQDNIISQLMQDMLLLDSNKADTTYVDNQIKDTKAYTDTKVAGLVDSAPGTLDTLNELAAALGNNPNFATTMATELGKKATATDLNTHAASHIHITTDERTKWNTAKTHADSAHAPSNAERNIIIGIQKNGDDVSVDSNRKVNITVPTKTSELTNNSDFATNASVNSVKDALQANIDGKADTGHTHAISDVSGLQTALDGKAASSHGTHVAYSATTPVMDGTASVGSASTVARSDHKHPTDTSRASQTDFDTHTSNTTVHITSTERSNWNAAKTHADSAHAPSNAQANIIETVKVNGTALTVTNKAVNVTVPTGTLASKNEVSESELDATLARKLNGKADSDHNHDDKYYTEVEIDNKLNGYVVNTRKVNGKSLNVDITLSASDVGALPNTTSIPDSLSDLSSDSIHRTVTDAEKETWNAKSNFSGNYNDLTNKPTIPSIAGLATTAYVDNAIDKIEFPDTDLSDYYTKTETDIAIEAAKEEISENIVSESDAVNIVDSSGNIILSVDANGAHTTNLMLNGENVATELYVDNIAKLNGIPAWTSADEGKFLRIVNGVPTWVAIPNAEEAMF